MWTPSTRGALHLMGAVVLVAAACGRKASAPAPGPAPNGVEVGYGEQQRDKVTGAVTSLSGDDVTARRPLRIEELLRGKVAGLQIVQGPNGPSFRLRGTGSMLVDQEPLVVVDGVPIPSGSTNSALSGLMPGDIRQVNVLKDVASTSIYGMRGAGGVIVIVTKRDQKEQ